jgi:hypothetical protein
LDPLEKNYKQQAFLKRILAQALECQIEEYPFGNSFLSLLLALFRGKFWLPVLASFVYFTYLG